MKGRQPCRVQDHPENGLVVSIEGDNMGVKDLRGFMSQVDLNALESLQRKGKS